MNLLKNKKLLVLLVIFLRLSAAILILFSPVWGFIIYMIFDELDCRILCDIRIPCKRPYRESYEVLDKALDLSGYLTMFVVSLKTPLFVLMAFLFAYRLIGNLLFISTRKESLLVWFPDFFTFAFIWLVLAKEVGLDIYLGQKLYSLGSILLFPVKLFHEYLLHIYWPAYLKNRG